MTQSISLTEDRRGVQLGGDTGLTIRFKRTNRIKDDGQMHALPPDLGNLPVRRVADYASRVPQEWLARGGVMIPMHDDEAMWMSFAATGRIGYGKLPAALKVGLGMVNAVTGETWRDGLHSGDKGQDYMVCPPQPWLDGIKSEQEGVRQFIAKPLGSGTTVEGQVTGKEVHGGLQLALHAMRADLIAQRRVEAAAADMERSASPLRSLGFAGAVPESEMLMDASMPVPASAASGSMRRSRGGAKKVGSMGMGAGGRMRQLIYDDPYGINTWNETADARLFVHLVPASDWYRLTGEQVAQRPGRANQYTPGYDLADQHLPHVPGSQPLAGVKSVEQIEAEIAESEQDAFVSDDVQSSFVPLVGTPVVLGQPPLWQPPAPWWLSWPYTPHNPFRPRRHYRGF